MQDQNQSETTSCSGIQSGVLQDIRILGHRPNIFGDGIAFAQKWDFSKANLNEANRVRAITQVASICYQSPKSLGSESLYNRLAAESMGLPSSSFEFVPVLVDPYRPGTKDILQDTRSNVRKFGEWISFTDVETGEIREALLTNYRAMYYDYEKTCAKMIESYKNDIETLDAALGLVKNIYLDFFNTEEECKIISKHFNVFLYKVDFPTRSQMVRHRVNWQELSRRYVSGKRVGFDFYISEGMKKVWTIYKPTNEVYGSIIATPQPDDVPEYSVGTQDAIDICLQVYFAALEQGIKPQEARRIIPQAAYTQIWGAFMPSQLENYFKLRLDEHAQWEIRKTAEAMQSLNSTVAILKDHSLTHEMLDRISSNPNDFLTSNELDDLLNVADAGDQEKLSGEEIEDLVSSALS